MITIYAIENCETGQSYIGCTAGKPQKRWREHRCLLRAGHHACISLQKDWNEFGEGRFRLIHLDHLDDGSSVVRKRQTELDWMETFATRGQLYNERRIAFQAPPGASAKAAAARVANGYKPSAESNLKRRLAQLGIPKGHGAKISQTKRARKNK